MVFFGEKFLIDKGLLKRGRPWPVADFAPRIWNADETGFCLGAASKNILACQGDRKVGGASDHQFITVNTCGNTEGSNFLYLFYIKERIFITPGHMVVQLEQSIALVSQDGWKKPTMSIGLRSNSILL